MQGSQIYPGDIPNGMEENRDSFKSMIQHIILMLIFYTVIIKMNVMLVSQIPHLPILSEIFESFQWLKHVIRILRSGIIIITGVIAIRILGGGLRQYGVTLKSDKLYIVPAIVTGFLLILIQTGLLLLPSLLSGHGFVMYSGNGMERIYSPVPYNVLNHLLVCFSSLAGVFLLHGVVQTYLMDKINRVIMVRSWNFHVACFIVTLLVFLQAFIPFRYSMITGILMVFVNLILLRALLTFVCAYWYEKSRSLVAPAIAHVLYGFWFVFVTFLYNRFGG